MATTTFRISGFRSILLLTLTGKGFNLTKCEICSRRQSVGIYLNCKIPPLHWTGAGEAVCSAIPQTACCCQCTQIIPRVVAIPEACICDALDGTAAWFVAAQSHPQGDCRENVMSCNRVIVMWREPVQATNLCPPRSNRRGISVSES